MGPDARLAQAMLSTATAAAPSRVWRPGRLVRLRLGGVRSDACAEEPAPCAEDALPLRAMEQRRALLLLTGTPDADHAPAANATAVATAVDSDGAVDVGRVGTGMVRGRARNAARMRPGCDGLMDHHG